VQTLLRRFALVDGLEEAPRRLGIHREHLFA
jgi:hypothetical protein